MIKNITAAATDAQEDHKTPTTIGNKIRLTITISTVKLYEKISDVPEMLISYHNSADSCYRLVLSTKIPIKITL